jgi:electron transfer flavoprotein beta subunit
MHIVVLLKQVHEPNTPPSFFSIGADGSSLALQSGTSMVLNAYDANAIEEAIRIKERFGGTVTAISVGDSGALNHIRRALAMGADRGLRVEGPTGIDCDPAAVAALIAAAISKLDRVDLVLCGRQASDTDAGQVPFELAHRLGYAPVSPVTAIPAVRDQTVEVHRIGENGTQHLRVQLPALLALSNEINKPRAPGLKGVMQAKKTAIPTWSAAELGVSPPAPRLVRSALVLAPRKTTEAELLRASSGAEAGRALADRLRREGLL